MNDRCSPGTFVPNPFFAIFTIEWLYKQFLGFFYSIPFDGRLLDARSDENMVVTTGIYRATCRVFFVFDSQILRVNILK